MQYKLKTFLLFTIWSITIQAQSEDWKLEKDKKDVKVYTKSMEGFDVKAFKAIGYVDAPVEHVYNVIKTIANYDKWYPDCKKGELLEAIDEKDEYRRVVYKLPWPFDPRDVVGKMVCEKIDNGILMTTTNASDYIPEVDKVVRITKVMGYWKLEGVEGKTKITYVGAADSGGVPAWIVNLFIVGGPIDAINNLREMIKDPQYQFVPSWLE